MRVPPASRNFANASTPSPPIPPVMSGDSPYMPRNLYFAFFQPAAARPVPYMKDAKYKFLGMYGESPDITGGMGGEGVDAFAKFLDAGGTLVAMGNAVRFPTDMGLTRTVDASAAT